MLISANCGNAAKDAPCAEKTFKMYKDAGIGAVDYNFDCVFEGYLIRSKKQFPLFDSGIDKMAEHFKAIKTAADKYGIVFGQTHAPFSSQLVGGDTCYNAYLKDLIIACIKMTAVLGAPYIVIHPVFADNLKQLTPEEEHRLNIDFYSSLIPALKENGVVACLENMWVGGKSKIYGAICSDMDEANEYIDELNEIAGEQLFGFCYDSGHATLVGQDHRKNLKRIARNLKALHLHDVDGLHDNHTLPFYGITDWEYLMKALSEIGYSGTLNFEASYGWQNIPAETRGAALNLLGAFGKHFLNTYFNI